MFDPLRPLKYLPWIPLLQAALITILLTMGLDICFSLLSINPLVGNLLMKLFSPPLGEFINLGLAIGVGALGVVVLERWFKQVILNSATLWALVPCLALCLWLRSFLELGAQLTPAVSYVTLMLIIVGVFWKGRRYWRWG
jgi:hypothetical protein